MSDDTIIALLIACLIAVYFLPAIIASRRKHQNPCWIFWLNLFFGATGIAWLILLIWAIAGQRRVQS